MNHRIPSSSHQPPPSFTHYNPATHPNTILIRNPTPIPNHIRSDQYIPPPKSSTRTPSTSYDFPPGFPIPRHNYNKPIVSSASTSSNSYDFPPGFPIPRLNSASGKGGFVNWDSIEGIKNYESRLDLEKRKRVGRTELDRNQTICITNVSKRVADDVVLKSCSVFGKVESFKRFNSMRGINISHCLVKYHTHEQAAKAVIRLCGTRRFARSWRATWARKELEDCGIIKTTAIEEGEFKTEILGVENKEVVEYLCNSWMIVVEKQRSLEEIRKMIDSVGVQASSLIRWGLHGVIAVCRSEDMNKWQSKQQDLLKIFVHVQKFEANKLGLCRYCWIECRGIPVGAWSIGTMENIANKWGKLIAVDKETELMHRADVAKLFVEITEIERIQVKTVMTFKKEMCKLVVTEVNRYGNVEFLVTQDSCLGLPPVSSKQLQDDSKSQLSENDIGTPELEGAHGRLNVVEGDDVPVSPQQDVDLGGVSDRLIQSSGIVKCHVGSPCSKMGIKTTLFHLQTNSLNSDQPDGNSESLSSDGDNTMVPQTNSTQEYREQVSPISKSGTQPCIKVNAGNGVCNVRNCVGCENFKRKKQKEVQGVEATIDNRTPTTSSSVFGKDKLPNFNISKRSKAGPKKLMTTPLRLGPKGFLEGRIAKTTKRKSSKLSSNLMSGASKLLGQKESAKKACFGIETGLRICDEIGLNLSISTARKLKFNELFQSGVNADPDGLEKEAAEDISAQE